MAALTFDDLLVPAPGAAPPASGGAAPPASGGAKGPLTFDDLVAAPPAEPAPPAAAPPSAADTPGILQQLFDVKNASTGQSYLYGNTPAPTPYEDLQRSGRDTMSRGYYDKLGLEGTVPRLFGADVPSGPEQQARTEAAREREPGWVETPTDIAAAVASSPFRIGSMGAGALFGGAEGALSEYGHQKEWVPDIDRTLDILKSAGMGAVTGGVGAKVGEKIGNWWSGKQAAKAQPYKTDTELAADAKVQPANVDLAERAARVEAIRAAQGTGSRDAFAKMRAGMQGATPTEAAKMATMADSRGFWDRLGNNPVTRAMSLGGRGTSRTIGHWLGSGVADTALHAIVPIPGAVTGARLLATGARGIGNTDWAKRIPQGQWDELAALARDPSGRGISSDPETVARFRDAFAKIGIGYGREP